MRMASGPMMRLLPRCLIVVILLLAASAHADDSEPLGGRHAFKGWELYSWQDAAEWRFSLLLGTNRYKFCAEVKNPKGARDLAGAEQALGRLAEMEWVSWTAPFERLPEAPCPSARPPTDMTDRLWQVCQRRNLFCTGWDKREPLNGLRSPRR